MRFRFDSGGAAETPVAGALAALLALATPLEAGGCGIPAGDGVIQPGDQVLLTLGMLAGEGATANDALQRLGHVEPGAAEWRVQRHDAMLEQPVDDRPTEVAGEIVPNEDGAQGGQRRDRRMPQPGLPLGERGTVRFRRLDYRQASQDLLQFRHEPGVQDGVRAAGHRLGAQGAGGRTEQGEQLRGPTPDILMRLTRRLGLGLPGGAGLGDRLVGTGFILAEDRDPPTFRLAVRLLDQPLFCSVSGSTTVTEPLLRCRTAVPVGHQVLLR